MKLHLLLPRVEPDKLEATKGCSYKGCGGKACPMASRRQESHQEYERRIGEKTQPELQRVARDAHAIQRYEIATNYPMTVQGYMRYWRKKHPERL
jgi:hypothetical protein